jgi:outer membrane protein TolC
MLRYTFILALSFGFAFFGYSQKDTLRLGLTDVVVLAESGSPDAQIAKTQLNNNFWRYQSFLANYKPQINFEATLPNLNRSIEAITLPDGSDIFLSRSLMRNNVGITLQQDIALTGGRIFASTGLQRIDIFKNNTNPGSLSYLSSPISIGLIQPLLGFNALKWDKKIEPLRYQEATRGYSEDQAEIAYQAANRFFDVLIAQLNVEAAIRDKANADTLYQISKSRYDVGKIAETELLQIELNARNAETTLAQSQFDLQNSTEQLRNFLGIRTPTAFQLVPPYDLPEYIVDPIEALEMARKHRSQTVNFARRRIEADRNIAQAKGETGFSADIFASFGLSQTGPNLGESYTAPLNQEQIQIGIALPIADWGKTQARLEIAASNAELIRMQVQQDEINFDQEIIIKVNQFQQVRQQAVLADRSYEIALKRLDITRKRYRIGKIDVTDLNLAISEEANARRGYISALRNFWLAAYDLRRITLYDFENGVPLIRE